jgi:hypothetical protein
MCVSFACESCLLFMYMLEHVIVGYINHLDIRYMIGHRSSLGNTSAALTK